MHKIAVVPLAALWLAAGPAWATSVEFSDNSTIGSDAVTATATFTLLAGNQLQLVLTNTSPSNSQETPTNTLTGLAFSFNNATVQLGALSATASSVLDPSGCSPACNGSNVNVGGEYGYDIKGNTDRVGAAGYITTGLTADQGNFNSLNAPGSNTHAGTNLAGNGLQGIDFGIVSSNAKTADFNGGLSGTPLVQNSTTFVFSYTGTLSLSTLDNVSFLYGTSPDATIAGSLVTNGGGSGTGGNVPEPGSLSLLGIALAGMVTLRRRRHVAAA